jgi:hypothetical protein
VHAADSGVTGSEKGELIGRTSAQAILKDEALSQSQFATLDGELVTVCS